MTQTREVGRDLVLLFYIYSRNVLGCIAVKQHLFLQYRVPTNLPRLLATARLLEHGAFVRENSIPSIYDVR